MRDSLAQHQVFEEARGIYSQRGEVRGQVWKDFDATDSAHHLRSKAARIEEGLKMLYDPAVELEDPEELVEVIIDECLDAINYAAFTVRHLRGETADKRPPESHADGSSQGPEG